MRFSRKKKSIKRSGFEDKIDQQLALAKVDYAYEPVNIPYMQPAKKRTYTPDFLLNGKLGKTIYLETKGQFLSSDRKKLLLIKEQYPTLDLRIVFTNSKTKIAKGSKTTYADWCKKNNFLYADKAVPVEWLQE